MRISLRLARFGSLPTSGASRRDRTPIQSFEFDRTDRRTPSSHAGPKHVARATDARRTGTNNSTLVALRLLPQLAGELGEGPMKLRKMLALGLCVVAVVTTAGVSAAQDFRGRINGTVTDNTGAVLPGVTVTATSPALIQPQVQVTGADGGYRFIALPPGVYEVTSSCPASRTSSAKAFASSSTRR